MPKLPFANAFQDAVREALENFKNPLWLGENSPLATAYLLSKTVNVTGASPQERGQGLQELLCKAAARIPADSKVESRYRDLIRYHYFEGQSAVKVQDTLKIGNDTFYKSRPIALASLVKILIEELQPALITESAPKVHLELIDRTQEIGACLAALRMGQTVTVDGMDGCGKTMVGSAVAEHWGRSSVFWYTVRPGFNDYVEIFLFLLACFLRSLGSPHLWLELIASPGKVSIAVVSGLLRHAFTTELKTPALLCIDDADLLKPLENLEHDQIKNLVAELRSCAPILLMGQHVRIEAEQIVRLKKFSPIAVNQYLQQRDLRLSVEQVAQIHHFTAGNPRLLSLFAALHQIGVVLPSVLQQMTETPSLEFMVERIWQRLSAVERTLMLELAIVQDGLPIHAWHDRATTQAIVMLNERQLLQTDGQSKIWLLPAFAETIVKLVPVEQLSSIHEQTALRFAGLGQFTTAAYHYIQAGQTSKALLLWDDHQQQEINQGQAARALYVFRQALVQPLAPVERERVTFLCAELERTIGNWPRAQEDLHTLRFETPLLAVKADTLAGEIANDHLEWEEAEHFFQRGITQAAQIVELNLVRLHKGLGWRFRGERQLDQARYEAQRARYELDNFMGLVEEEYCHYPQAIEHYQAALALAEQLDHTEGIAKTCNNLAGLHARLGQFQEAYTLLARSDLAYHKIGKRLSLAKNKQTYGYIHNLAGKHKAALAVVDEAFALLREWDIQPDASFIVYTNQMIAEAHLGLGQLSEAETYVKLVIEAKEAGLLSDAYRTYAEILHKKQQNTQALAYLEQAITWAQKLDDPYLEAYAWRAQGQVLIALQKPAKAQAAFHRATELFQDRNLTWEVTRTITLCLFPLSSSKLNQAA